MGLGLGCFGPLLLLLLHADLVELLLGDALALALSPLLLVLEALLHVVVSARQPLLPLLLLRIGTLRPLLGTPHLHALLLANGLAQHRWVVLDLLPLLLGQRLGPQLLGHRRLLLPRQIGFLQQRLLGFRLLQQVLVRRLLPLL